MDEVTHYIISKSGVKVKIHIDPDLYVLLKEQVFTKNYSFHNESFPVFAFHEGIKTEGFLYNSEIAGVVPIEAVVE